MQKFAETITRENARGFLIPVQGQVTVYLANTATLASIYDDDDVTPLNNPLTADVRGLVQFKLANGNYDFVFSNGLGEVRVDGVVAFDGVSGGAGQEATGTIDTVVACSTILPIDNTIPVKTEGTEVVTVTVQPDAGDSEIELTFTASGSTTAGMFIGAAVFQDAITNALVGSTCIEQTTGANQKFLFSWTFRVPAGSTSSRTYRLRIGPGATGTAYVNGDSAGARLMGGMQVASITAREVFA